MDDVNNSKSCLVIFCKRPTLSKGKQRLAKTIGAEQALIFAQAFLDCALEDAEEWDGPVVLSPASNQDLDWAKGLLQRDCKVLCQPEGNLGVRLQEIDRQLRDVGFERVILMGTDAPILMPDHYQQANAALFNADIVLSAASDGGVTIMGAAVPWPNLTNLPWSTERLGSELEKLCLEKGCSVENISHSYDIDIEDDLEKLWHDLANDMRPKRRHLYQLLDNFFIVRKKYA